MVDEGIVDLVKTINQIPDVFTISSCQGDEDTKGYVTFLLQESADDKPLYLLQNLTALFGDWPDTEVNLRWKFGGPVFNIILPGSRIKEASKRINSLSLRIKDGMKPKNESADPSNKTATPGKR